MDAIGMNWIVARLLCEDGTTIEVVGNAFQVKGAFANVDDLKEAIEKKEKLTIAASKINVYSLKDRNWVKEDEDNEVNRGTSKPSPWFR
eukprot:s3799_g13.t1